MADGNQPLLSFYEQGMAILNREIELLYQRMSFFLAGMSFLVAAMATILALHRSLVIPILAVISLGLVLSFLFTIASSLSGRFINNRQSYVSCMERRLNAQAVLNGPNIDIDSSGQLEGCLGRIFDCSMHSHPASLTLIVPEIFVDFWCIMLVYLWKTGSDRWLWILVTGIIILVLLFVIIHQLWRPWKRKGWNLKVYWPNCLKNRKSS